MDGTRFRALVCAALCVLLPACSSKADRIESGLHKGARYVASSDWDKASVEARNVLQMDPKNADAILIVAQVEDGKGAFRNAYASYSKVLELKPNAVDARLGLARLHLLSGDLKQAGDLISAVLGADAQNVRARSLDAALQARRGEKDLAIAQADSIVKSGLPLPIESGLLLAGLYFNANFSGAALNVLDKAIAGHPHEARLLQMAAEIAQSATPDAARLSRADGYYALATTVAPKDDGLWRSWATMYIRANDISQAESVLRKATRADPDDPVRTIALLQFTAAFRDKGQAEKDFLAAIDAHPKNTELRFALADFYREQKRPDTAIAILQAMVDGGKATPAAAIARGQLAALWMEEGKTDQARTTLAELLKGNPRDATGLVLRGRLQIADGDARAAIADLRSAAKDKPGSTEIAALLSRAHHLAGEPELAREALADAVKFNGDDARAHLMLAADMAETKEFRAAIPEVDAAIKADPKNQAARQMKIEMAMATGDFGGAEAEAREIELRFPGSPLGHLLHGRVLAREKKFAPALAQYDAAGEVAPGSPDPKIAAAGLLISQRKFADVDRRIDALAKANPNSVLAREMRGELALAMGDLPLAQESFRQLVDMPGAPPSAYKNLAAVMVSRKNLPDALAVLDKGEQANPADVTLASARAEWLGLAGRTDEAIAVYEQILRRAPASELAANNLAYVLVETRRDKASLARALQLADRFASSTQPNYVDTLGLVHYRLGRYDQAAILLGRAATLAPGDAGVQLHYGMALFKKGDVQQGAEIVRKALANKTPLADHDEAQALLASS